MKVLVCGGRHYSDRAKVFEVLDYLHLNRKPITLLIHGAATGADKLGEEWANDRGVEPDAYPAAWGDLSAKGAVIKSRKDGSSYNANAGPTRNSKMLALGKPDFVVAFPGGDGTANMISQARMAGVRVFEIADPREQAA